MNEWDGPGRPCWQDLPDVGGGARSAWGVAGPDDELGTMGLLTPERTVRAAGLVRTGRRVPLHLPLGQPDPPLFAREPLQHRVMRRSAFELDDRLDAFYPQSGSQWDALAHFGHPRLGFYGGRTVEQVENGELGIHALAAGVVGRGVLLDVAAWAADQGRPLEADARTPISPADALATAAAQGTSLEPGDVWCVRTGWGTWWASLDADDRGALSRRSRGEEGAFASVGLGPGRAWAELLWDAGAAAVVADNPGVDVLPPARGEGNLHVDGLALLGLWLGELFVLDALADACREQQRWEFLFIAAPLPLPGGIGSPANAVAVL